MFIPFRRSSDRKPGLFATHASKARRDGAAQPCAPLLGRVARGPPDALDLHRHEHRRHHGDRHLRWAITESNDTTGPNTIDFDITNPTGGLLEIKLGSPLPSITTPVNIDGASQTGSSATSPLIQIDGTSAGSSAYGLRISEVGFWHRHGCDPGERPGDHRLRRKAACSWTLPPTSIWSGLFVGVQECGRQIPMRQTPATAWSSAEHKRSALRQRRLGQSGPRRDPERCVLCHAHGRLHRHGATGEAFNDQNGNSLGNNGDGVLIDSSTTSSTVANTVVVNNSGQGVEITNSSPEHNQLTGDSIGSYLVGAFFFFDAQPAEWRADHRPASDNTIGGTATGSGNVISGNMGDGVEITGSGHDRQPRRG